MIAFSEKTAVEMFSLGDHILGIQGHPEYTKGILYNLADRLAGGGAIDVRATHTRDGDTLGLSFR